MDEQQSSEALPPLDTSDPHRLLASIQRLSLGTPTETPLPPSSAINTPQRERKPQGDYFPNEQRYISSPIDTALASSRLDSGTSPVLLRKASTSSLRNSGMSTPRRSPSRRASSTTHAASPTTSARSPLPTPMEKEHLTAAAVANTFFQAELQSHDAPDLSTDTVVLLHDACYGHRYSRPKTSKNILSTIVERPERILAGVLGISTAFVRLQGAHAGERNAPHPTRMSRGQPPFKIRKSTRQTSIASPAVTAVHGTKWMEELQAMCTSAGWNLATTGKELARPLDPNLRPGQPTKEKLHEGDLYLCTESLEAFQGAIAGVLDAVDIVFEGAKTGGPTRAFSCIRPPGHHCSADYPSGFCWINNVHVGIEHAAQNHGLTHAAIIDFDLHHGDGSQSITWDRNAKVARMPKNTPNWKKSSIGYFSLHDINSYPCEYGDPDKVRMASLCLENAHGQSIWNVHLQPWKTEAEFWKLYEDRYVVLIEKARAYLQAQTDRLKSSPNQLRPKAAIFISAGFDASEWESQGMQRHKVNVPTEFYARFTRDIVAMSVDKDTGVEGRVISVLEGGYSDRALTSGVMSHLCGLSGNGYGEGEETALSHGIGLGVDMNRRMAGLGLDDDTKQSPKPSLTPSYNADWWHSSRMSELELVVYPAPPPAPKKPKAGTPSTFASATQSSTAKVIDPTKIRRTPSGMLRSSSVPLSRPTTPPPPDVDWTIAAHELSKLLIPTDRQTKSCKPEELAATRLKKERQSIAAVPVDPLPSGRQLRGRKGKTPSYVDGAAEDDGVAALVSRASRRQTIADVPKPPSNDGEQLRSRSRRVSMASNISSTTASRARDSDSSTKSQASKAVPARPSSSAAVPKANAVQAKKRLGSSIGRDTSKPRSSSKQPVIPRIPSGISTSGQGERQDLQPTTKTEDNDLEQLTSGLKRITIKMPKKEEYDARPTKQTGDTEKKKPVSRISVPKKPSTTKVTKSMGIKKLPTAKPTPGASKPAVSSNAVTSPAEPTVQQLANSALAGTQQPTQTENAPSNHSKAQQANGAIKPQVVPLALSTVESVSNSENIPSSSDKMTIDGLPTSAHPESAQESQTQLPESISSQSRRSESPAPQFIAFIPPSSSPAASPSAKHGASASSGQESQTTSLQWLPPNSDAALPASVRQSASPAEKLDQQRTGSMNKALPSFSAKGVIPFAAPHPQGQPQTTSMAVNMADTGLLPGIRAAAEEQSVWDIPETPAKQ